MIQHPNKLNSSALVTTNLKLTSKKLKAFQWDWPYSTGRCFATLPTSTIWPFVGLITKNWTRDWRSCGRWRIWTGWLSKLLKGFAGLTLHWDSHADKYTPGSKATVTTFSTKMSYISQNSHPFWLSRKSPLRLPTCTPFPKIYMCSLRSSPNSREDSHSSTNNLSASLTRDKLWAP